MAREPVRGQLAAAARKFANSGCLCHNAALSPPGWSRAAVAATKCSRAWSRKVATGFRKTSCSNAN